MVVAANEDATCIRQYVMVTIALDQDGVLDGHVSAVRENGDGAWETTFENGDCTLAQTLKMNDANRPGPLLSFSSGPNDACYEASVPTKLNCRHSGAPSATETATSVATVTIASATKLHGGLRILTSLGPMQDSSTFFLCHVPLSVVFSKVGGFRQSTW